MGSGANPFNGRGKFAARRAALAVRHDIELERTTGGLAVAGDGRKAHVFPVIFEAGKRWLRFLDLASQVVFASFLSQFQVLLLQVHRLLGETMCGDDDRVVLNEREEPELLLTVARFDFPNMIGHFFKSFLGTTALVYSSRNLTPIATACARSSLSSLSHPPTSLVPSHLGS